jgi:hypothetical protein
MSGVMLLYKRFMGVDWFSSTLLPCEEYYSSLLEDAVFKVPSWKWRLDPYQAPNLP